MTSLPGSPPPSSSPEDPSSGSDHTLASSAVLYSRWERNPWSVATVECARDARPWHELGAFAREELRNGLTELEVGEYCVSETLSSLVDTAPEPDDRLYLCTQLADEARHVRFFRSYLEEAVGIDFSDPSDGPALEGRAEYRLSFEPELRRATADVRRPDSTLREWYEAVVYYHLLTEGVLAFTALQWIRQLARRLRLPALFEGLTNVTRDEARHVTFGLRAVRDGVSAGHREHVLDVYLRGVSLTAQVLVAPSRKVHVPMLGMAQRVGQMVGQWRAARSRVERQLVLIGLTADAGKVHGVWCSSMNRALDAYQARWDEPHPARRVPGVLDDVLSTIPAVAGSHVTARGTVMTGADSP